MSQERNTKIKYVAILGMGGNIILLIIKLIVGFSSHSQAMIADGLNSAGDVFSSLMTYIGNNISSKPYDKDHPYGHGKAEYIFSMIISFSLIVVSFSIIKNAMDSLSNKDVFLFSPWLPVVALVTIVTKFLLFVYCNRIGHKYSSLLAYANAQDHRNDVFITSFTLISIITGYFNLFIVDAIVGSFIGLWIGYTGIRIFTSAYNVLMDTTLDAEVKEELMNVTNSIEGVDHVDAIASTPVGLNYLLVVKISVDGNLSVLKGHDISDLVKKTLMEYDYIDEVVVHVNPTQLHPQKNGLK